MFENEIKAESTAEFFLNELRVTLTGEIVPAAPDKEHLSAKEYLAQVILQLLNAKDIEHARRRKARRRKPDGKRKSAKDRN